MLNGYVPGCLDCRHAPGEHAIPAHHGAPQPCEAAGCDCADLVRPDRGVGGVMRNFPGQVSTGYVSRKRGSRVA